MATTSIVAMSVSSSFRQFPSFLYSPSHYLVRFGDSVFAVRVGHYLVRVGDSVFAVRVGHYPVRGKT